MVMAWDLTSYRTLRVDAGHAHSIEVQASEAGAIRVPHRGWETVSVHLGGPADLSFACSDYVAQARVERGTCQLVPGGWQHVSAWSSAIVVLHVHLAPSRLCGRRLRLVPNLRDPVVADLGAGLYDCARGRGDTCTIRRLVAQLSAHLVDRHSVEGAPAVPRQRIGSEAFADVHRRMRGPQAVHVRLEDLAAQTGLSPRQFRHRFRQIYGVAPKAFLLRHRIEHAKTLIREDTMTLTQVAHAAGFCDQAHFTHAFRARAKTTPSDYRRWLRR